MMKTKAANAMKEENTKIKSIDGVGLEIEVSATNIEPTAAFKLHGVPYIYRLSLIMVAHIRIARNLFQPKNKRRRKITIFASSAL